MSSSTTSTTVASSEPAAKMSAKSTKSLVVKFSLPPAELAKWPSATESLRKQSRSKPSPLSQSQTSSDTAPQVVEPSPSELPSESNTTPVPTTVATTDNNSLAPPPTMPKRKGVPGPRPGTKRGAALMADGMPKPRGKPGPKKKPRPGDDPALAKGPFAGVAPITQKLGPRANQGAINAGLRALDRSGKPCRKWEKKGFQVKSFTGVVWSVPTWRAPHRAAVDSNGDVQSDTTASSETKMNVDSSAVPSEKNSSPGDQDTPNPSQPVNLPSSPALAVEA